MRKLSIGKLPCAEFLFSANTKLSWNANRNDCHLTLCAQP